MFYFMIFNDYYDIKWYELGQINFVNTAILTTSN